MKPVRFFCLSILILILFSSCRENMKHQDPYFYHGHRGARGLFPENSLPAFLIALDLGVYTLEMDVVVSADSHLVVSHEPWMASGKCLDPGNDPITAEEEMGFNLYQMRYGEIRRFDCGSLGNPDFPEQKKMRSFKPLLRDVINTCDTYARRNETPLPRFNIELKSHPKGYGTYIPHPAGFSTLFTGFIDSMGIQDRMIVQSFDPELLRLLNRTKPGWTYAYLVEKAGTPESYLEELGFQPRILSPEKGLVDEALVRSCHWKGIQVIPWTVNEPSEMRRLIDLNVDGIITDYPNRVLRN